MQRYTYQTVFFILLFGIFLSSCAAKLMVKQLSGQYQDEPFYVFTTKSYDKTWNIMIDFFAKKGIAITTVDKSTGLIVARNQFTTATWTHEENGKPINPEAYLVVSTCGYMKGYTYKDFHPQVVEGDWNVRIREESGGRVSVNINLYNLAVKGKAEYIGARYYPNPCTFIAKSTRVFEKSLAGLFAGE